MRRATKNVFHSRFGTLCRMVFYIVIREQPAAELWRLLTTHLFQGPKSNNISDFLIQVGMGVMKLHAGKVLISGLARCSPKQRAPNHHLNAGLWDHRDGEPASKNEAESMDIARISSAVFFKGSFPGSVALAEIFLGVQHKRLQFSPG